MSISLLEDIAAQSLLQPDDPEERYLISGVSWEEYESLLESLGDSPWYRVTYLEGMLEIMAPSRRHESKKTNIGMFLEAYFQETRIRFYGLGSTTFRQRIRARGTEPDESYCLETEKEFPDVAIEVIETSGGIDKLAVYLGLGVPEVWFWQNKQFKVYCLRNGVYELSDRSELLPNLDLTLLADLIQKPEPLDAVWEFKVKIQEQIRRDN